MGCEVLTHFLKSTKRHKGQGIIEYALLLAFIVGIAVMLNGANLGGTVKDTFNTVARFFSGEKTYAEYFTEWKDKSAEYLRNIDQKERLNADQEALAIIARQFIGLDETGVKNLIASLSLNRNNQVQFDNGKNYKEGANGWSNSLVPLSYQTNGLDDATGQYIHLDFNGNVDTVKFLSTDAQAYRGKDSANIYSTNDAALGDRIFYSDGMILQAGDSATADDKRMVTLQVHYQDGVVDQVNIQARKGNTKTDMYDSSKIVEGLDVNVTKTEIKPNGNSN